MIRLGKLNDIKDVNLIRKEVNDLHAKSEPTIFKGFSPELEEYIKEFVGDNKDKFLLVYEDDEKIYGYAMLEIISKPETSYKYAERYLEVHELGVTKTCHSKGYGKLMMEEIKKIAVKEKLNQIRLDAWSFNTNAIEFYKKRGYEIYREYFRIFL